MLELTSPRWTHIALPVADLDSSIAFYESFTPLVVLERFSDEHGRSAWLVDNDAGDEAFVLVLVSFDASEAHATLAPFAHLGIEVQSKEQLDELASRAREASCLAWEPRQLPFPVGYVCALRDPDGNVIEISYGQGVYQALTQRSQEIRGRS